MNFSYEQNMEFWPYDANPNLGFEEEEEIIVSSIHENKRKNSIPLIKGQWTEEEDRKLIKLVRQFGVKSWAKIAENLDSRAGKQCRERWHNHLRPDIKKESWTKEEEIILVKTHSKVGNKWAEIAKFIPGRSENSIKNHWNATKRRHNSRRKYKPTIKKIKNSQYSVLEDYIKTHEHTSTSPPNDNTVSPPHSTICTANNVPSSSFTSENSSSCITQTCDDEFQVLHQFFYGESLMENSLVSANTVTSLNSVRDEDRLITNQATSFSYPTNYTCDYGMNMEHGIMDQTCSNGKKDMDLIEMVSSHFFKASNSFRF